LTGAGDFFDSEAFLMALQKTFFGLPLATLESLQLKYLACLEAIAVAGASYSIAGRQFTRASMSEVKDTLRELQVAIDNAKGNRIKRVVTAFATQRP
jgi:hypothetical protein